MTAGQLRHRVQRFRYAETMEASGQVTKTWLPAETRFAQVKPVITSETLESGQVTARGAAEIKMRHFPELTEKDRLHFGSTIYNIEAIANPYERNRQTVATCRENV